MIALLQTGDRELAAAGIGGQVGDQDLVSAGPLPGGQDQMLDRKSTGNQQQELAMITITGAELILGGTTNTGWDP